MVGKMDAVSTSFSGYSFPYHFQGYETQKDVLLKHYLMVFLPAQHQVRSCYSKSAQLELRNHQRFVQWAAHEDDFCGGAGITAYA